MTLLSNIFELVLPVAHAEEPQQVIEAEEAVDEAKAQAEEEADEEEAEEEAEDEEEEDEDDDDEDELVDPLDTLTEECRNTAACKPFIHHFDHCVERVTAEMEEEDYAHKHYKEDCVEEFFHLQHCINDCVAPRLFHKLK